MSILDRMVTCCCLICVMQNELYHPRLHSHAVLSFSFFFLPCIMIAIMTCNIGQMTEALGFDSDLTPASLALFSAAQAASRVVTGSISESALTWDVPWFCGCFATGGSRGVSRASFLVLASLISAASHFALAVATTERGFALGVTLSGWAFGMTWPLMVSEMLLITLCKSYQRLICCSVDTS